MKKKLYSDMKCFCWEYRDGESTENSIESWNYFINGSYPEALFEELVQDGLLMVKDIRGYKEYKIINI